MDSRRWLLVIVLMACGVHLLYGTYYPAPPHSSHDAFVLIPQFQKVLYGYAPADLGLGMFHPSWFTGDTFAGGWSLFGDLLVENNRGRHWTQLPHPVALSAIAARMVPAWVSVQLVFAGYLAVGLLALYGIGSRIGGERVGLVAALAAAGFPGLFGFARYLECHLPVASLCTLVVWLLLRSQGLTQWRWCLGLSLATWSLTRTGEGAADLVAAGLVLIGPACWTAYVGASSALSCKTERPKRLRVWGAGLAMAVLPLVWLSDLAWIQGALVQILTAFRDPPVQYDVLGVEGGLLDVLAFHAAYPILIVCDYLGVCGSLLLGMAFLRVRAWPSTGRVLLALWWLIPLVAFSWMQRKASWYAIATVPPLALAVGLYFGKKRYGVWLVALVSLVQLVGGSFVHPGRLPTLIERLRQPVPAESWRLRRVELLRPSASPEMAGMVEQVRALLEVLEAELPPTGGLLHVGMLSRGYEYDYAFRYLLSVHRPDIEVVSVGDSRVRESGFRGLSAASLSAWVYLGDSIEAWPPTEEDLGWIRQDLACSPGDFLDAFLAETLEQSWREVSMDFPGTAVYLRDDATGEPLQGVHLCGGE